MINGNSNWDMVALANGMAQQNREANNAAFVAQSNLNVAQEQISNVKEDFYKSNDKNKELQKEVIKRNHIIKSQNGMIQTLQRENMTMKNTISEQQEEIDYLEGQCVKLTRELSRLKDE